MGAGACVLCTCCLGGLETGCSGTVSAQGRPAKRHTVINHYKPWPPFLLSFLGLDVESNLRYLTNPGGGW